MISFLTYSKVKNELVSIKESVLDIGSRLFEDDLNLFNFYKVLDLHKFLESCPLIDISIIDVSNESGLKAAEKARSNNINTLIVLLSESTVSPLTYVKPSIMASALMLRPLSVNSLNSVLKSIFQEHLKKLNKEDDNKNFVVDNRDGRQLVPYSNILYFESRNKKIYLNCKVVEYSFYNTLDNLENKLSDEFVRCHRSFIVSKKHIKKILLSQNIILLDNDYQIPISRTYRNIIKELR